MIPRFALTRSTRSGAQSPNVVLVRDHPRPGAQLA